MTFLTPSSICKPRNFLVATLDLQYAIPIVNSATATVAKPLRIGFTLKSSESVNLRKPTARNTTSTDAVAKTNPKTQAI